MRVWVTCLAACAFIGLVAMNMMMLHQRTDSDAVSPAMLGAETSSRPLMHSRTNTDDNKLDGLDSQWKEILHVAPAVALNATTSRSDVYECLAASRNATTSSLWTRVGQGNSAKRVVIFVHMPKCGGTALTTVLRRMGCEANRAEFYAATKDCCANPGFCQRAKGRQRTCQALLGCYGHQPQLGLYSQKLGFEEVKAVTMVRDPVSRVVSAWHYRCHNPNFDCFDVPGAAKWGAQIRRARGKPLLRDQILPSSNVSFTSYLGWPQYHNIQTRMLGRDEFPYASVQLDNFDLRRALDILDRKFALVAVFELFDHSLALLSDLAGVSLNLIDFNRVRASHSDSYYTFKRAFHGNASLIARVKAANQLDLQLHSYARARLCKELAAANLLGLGAVCSTANARAQLAPIEAECAMALRLPSPERTSRRRRR